MPSSAKGGAPVLRVRDVRVLGARRLGHPPRPPSRRFRQRPETPAHSESGTRARALLCALGGGRRTRGARWTNRPARCVESGRWLLSPGGVQCLSGCAWKPSTSRNSATVTLAVGQPEEGLRCTAVPLNVHNYSHTVLRLRTYPYLTSEGPSTPVITRRSSSPSSRSRPRRAAASRLSGAT